MEIETMYEEEVTKQIRQVLKEKNVYKISNCLYVIFKNYVLMFLNEENPNMLKVRTIRGNEYTCNITAAYSIISGYYSLYLEERKAEYSIDFNFKKLPHFISFLIKTYRKIIKKYGLNFMILMQDENLKGLLCMQDYIITWLLSHNYFVDYYVRDNNENLYIQEKLVNGVKESKHGKKK